MNAPKLYKVVIILKFKFLMYKKALHSFILKVHPDFYQSQPAWQRINEVSIATLNELLDWAKNFKNGVLSPPPSKRIEFEFKQRPSEGHSQTVSIKGIFELPGDFQANVHSRGIAERSVNKFLRNLLRDAGCLTDNEGNISRAQDQTLIHEENRQHATRPVKVRRRARKGPRTLLDEAADTMNSSSWTTGASLTFTPSLEDLLLHDMIYIDRDLTPKETSLALSNIQSQLNYMSFQRWAHAPLIISRSYSAQCQIPGAISIPYNFTAQQFITFLNRNDAIISSERSKIEHLANEVEGLITAICGVCSLDDVLLTNVRHTEALSTLKTLYNNTSLLLQWGMTHVSFEIANVPSGRYRANGVVIFPSRGLTDSTLSSFCKSLKSKMEALKHIYSEAKRMIDSILWHTQQFKDIVQPMAVEAFQDSVPYYHRLAWAKELHLLAPKIVEWDWSEFTFALGPLELNWESQLIVLPHNFDADSVARCIKNVSHEAIIEKQKELADDEQIRKANQEKSLVSRDQEQLLFPVKDNSGPSDKGAYSMDSETKDRLSQYQRPESMKDQQSGEGLHPLTIERPLHHQVHFHTEEDANEQMEWEGLQQSPYTSIVNEADMDDIAINYMRTNRWVREEAVKKMVQELNKNHSTNMRTRGKMGDILGLNNPNIVPSRLSKVIWWNV